MPTGIDADHTRCTAIIQPASPRTARAPPPTNPKVPLEVWAHKRDDEPARRGVDVDLDVEPSSGLLFVEEARELLDVLCGRPENAVRRGAGRGGLRCRLTVLSGLSEWDRPSSDITPQKENIRCTHVGRAC